MTRSSEGNSWACQRAKWRALRIPVQDSEVRAETSVLLDCRFEASGFGVNRNVHERITARTRMHHNVNSRSDSSSLKSSA